MSGIRSFVAVELDETARHDVSGLQDRLRATGADVKWTSPANLHLTLKFLGDVSPQDVPMVKDALEQALGARQNADANQRVRAFSIALADLGAFPNLSNPGVLWVGIDGGKEELTVLALLVEKAMARLGFPPEGRGFSPHLTLGRCRSKRNAGELKAAMEAGRSFRSAPFKAGRVVLFASVLTPAGPLYRPQASFLLAN